MGCTVPTPEMKKMPPVKNTLRPIHLALLRHSIQQSVESYIAKNRGALTLTGFLAASISTSAFYAAPTYSAGLERLNVLSSLGQPLRAEIDISATAAESGSLSVRLAPTSAYAQAGVEFSSALTSLRFSLERRANGQQYVRVSSVQPVNEPYIDMLVELNWSSGRLVREYTFLLDPPEMRPATQAPVAAPVASTPSRAPTPLPAERVPAASAVSSGAGAAQGGDGTYRVKSGDTLMKIARDHKPDSASLDQMLVALFRNNQDAFYSQNINRLKAGVVMRIPDAQTAQAVESGEARKFLSAQTSDFSAYRANLAQSVTESPKSTEPRTEASGRVSAKVEEKAAPAATQDQVKLSKLDQTRQDAAAKATAEELAAKERVLQEANTRVGMLEKNVADLEKLIELKNQNLAELQKQVQGKGEPVATPVPATPAASTPAPATPAAAPKPAPAAKVEPPKPTPASETSFLDSLTGNPMALYGIGAVVIGLLGFAVYRSRSSKKTDGAYDDGFLGSNSGLRANSIFGMTGGQSVDTSNSTFNSNFLPAAGAQVEQNEVDPIAEAEVYIAYGRDAQAEEILREALRTQPERHAVHVKLLEIYAKRQDVKSFETTANELYAATSGQGADWAQAATLGRTIDPENPLYQDAGSIPVVRAPLESAGPSTQPMEFSLPEVVPTLPTSELIQNTFSNPVTLSPVLDIDLTKTEPLNTEAPLAEEILPGQLDFGAGDHLSSTFLNAEPSTAEPDAKGSEDWAAGKVDFSFDLQDGAAAEKPVETSAPILPMVAEPMENLMQTVHVGRTPEAKQPSISDEVDLDLNLATRVAPRDDTSTELEASSFSTDSTLFMGGQSKMPEINLDLDKTPPEPPAFLDPSSFAKTEIESRNTGNWQEMATKLDLAMAYRDIGDKEGARELLDEVIKGGDTVQSDKAKEMLAAL